MQISKKPPTSRGLTIRITVNHPTQRIGLEKHGSILRNFERNMYQTQIPDLVLRHGNTIPMGACSIPMFENRLSILFIYSINCPETRLRGWAFPQKNSSLTASCSGGSRHKYKASSGMERRKSKQSKPRSSRHSELCRCVSINLNIFFWFLPSLRGALFLMGVEKQLLCTSDFRAH